MKLIPVEFPQTNSLADRYIREYDRVSHLYHYAPYRQESFSSRLEELLMADNRVKRSALTGALHAYNQRVNPHKAVVENINRLTSTNSVVVIGGQQAGVLTGPLYTIYKALTLVQLARQQEAQLGVPVVPVFWIAGEDHDWGEVNHIWTLCSSRLQRVTFGEAEGRRSVGSRKLSPVDVEAFLRQVSDAHPDSPYKRDWLNDVQAHAAQSRTWSDWFARLLHDFFGSEGLVLIDTAAHEFKHIGSEFYTQLIKNNDVVHQAVTDVTETLKKLGISPQVEIEPHYANVFLYEDGERSPLLKRGASYVSKLTGDEYTEQQLSHIALETPERLSTNVVTRPLLQEYLFPTLAVVLGPGEIAYWGQYGQAFQTFGWKMPVVFPRIGFTLIEPDVAKTLDIFGMTPADALFRLDHFRERWLQERDDVGIDRLFTDLRQKLTALYEKQTAPLLVLGNHMDNVIAKNEQRILREVRYLQKQAERALRQKYGAALDRLTHAELVLHPHNKLQERVYNVFSFINTNGWTWFRALLHMEIDLTNTHYAVYL